MQVLYFFLDKISKLLTYHTRLSTTNHCIVINVQKCTVLLAHPVDQELAGAAAYVPVRRFIYTHQVAAPYCAD